MNHSGHCVENRLKESQGQKWENQLGEYCSNQVNYTVAWTEMLAVEIFLYISQNKYILEGTWKETGRWSKTQSWCNSASFV